MKNDVNYRYENLFNDFDSVFDGINLIQMVEFATWSRIVNNVVPESLLDQHSGKSSFITQWQNPIRLAK